MNKKSDSISSLKRKRVKLSKVVYILLFVFLSSSAFTQVTVSIHKQYIRQALRIIESKTDYRFFYSNQLPDLDKIVSIDVDDQSIDATLVKLLEDTDLIYEKKEQNQIYLAVKKKEETSRKVSGTVLDQNGEPVIGANVVAVGTTNGTITDTEGRFSLTIENPNAVLEVRYIGYVNEKIAVNKKTTIHVVLKEDLQQLADVVVIGYGVQKKENLTGAVDAVKGEKISARTVASTSQSLQGISAGTTVINGGGEPGADGATIRIRGVGTFNNSDPLILVDGVTVSSIDNVDPQDIDNISILKDAASSAIYGARAANGVILITTKRGKSGAINVRYNGYVGWQSLTRQPKWVAADDYMRLVNEACLNANKEPKYSEDAIGKTMAGTDPYNYPNTDWWELLFRTALQHKHTFSVNGGTEKLKTAVSVNYLKREGVLINSDSEQYGVRANNDIKLSEKLDFGFDVNLNVRGREVPAKVGDVYWNLLHDVPPTVAARNPDGTYPLGPTNRNPLAAAEESGYQRVKNYQIIASPSFKYQVYKDLSLTARASIKEDFEIGKRYNNSYQFKDYETKQTALTWYSSLDEWNIHNHYIDWQVMGDYDKTIGHHYFHALVGFSQEYNQWKKVGASRRDFYSNDLQELNTGSAEGKNNEGNGNTWVMRSLFGRLNYAYHDKYLLEANFRYDGSSRFAKGRRYGFFPSFSGAWRISEEGFLKDKESLGNMKLRASWGKLGNQDIDLYQYMHTMALGQNYTFNGQLMNGAAQTALANELISWETTTSFDVGFDLGLWKNKLTMTADFYIRKTDDILLKRDIPATVGLTAPFQNVGSVKNTGWELALSYQDKVGDFEYSVTATLSDVKNKILKFGEKSTWDWYVNMEGESINSLYGYVSEGLFQTPDEVEKHAFQHTMTAPGDIKYKDINGDNVINGDDKVVLGSTIPRYSYGITLNGKYKGFDLNLFFNGVGKCNGYQLGALIEGPIWDGFTTKEMLDRWTPENTDATWPRLVYNTIHNQEASSFWIQNTSYFRLKNVQVGYTLPKAVLSRIHLKNVRVYVSGENMFTLTNAKNLDPEFPNGRATYYPQTKVFSFGLDVTF